MFLQRLVRLPNPIVSRTLCDGKIKKVADEATLSASASLTPSATSRPISASTTASTLSASARILSLAASRLTTAIVGWVK